MPVHPSTDNVGDVFEQMVTGAKNVLTHVLAVKPGENVLVVLDDSKRKIGEAFHDGASALGANVMIYSLSGQRRPLTETPKDLSDILANYSVIINTFRSDAQETPFRVKLLYEEISHQARVGHAPGITEDMMNKGPMNVDYRDVLARTDRMMGAFDGAEVVRITTKAGTDFTLNIKGRAFQTDVKIDKGTFGNLPAGEIWCGPVEDSADGLVIVDGTIGDIGRVSKPLKMEMRKGRIVAMESEDRKLVEHLDQLVNVDPMARVIGELGIGTNSGARLVGNMLEDEKAGGTAHIAFGNNMDMPGGQNNSETHRDFLFHKPTFEVRFKGGSSRVVIKDGEPVD